MTLISTDRTGTAPARTQLARNPVRPGYLVLGVTLLGAASWGAAVRDTGWWPVLVFALLPDIALLLAIGRPHRPGQLPAAAVPAYNLLHHPSVPVALAALAVAGLLSTLWLVAAAAWAAHIALDRGAGYGLRSRDGWQRG